MLVSMTGFGVGEAAEGGFRVRVEVRSLNHRYTDLVVRLAKPSAELEDRIRRQVLPRAGRGRLEIAVNWEEFGPARRRVMVDGGLLEAYAAALREAKRLLGDESPLRAESLLQVPGLVTVQEAPAGETLWPAVAAALEQALAAWEASRRAEGERLEAAILTYVEAVQGLVETIAMRAPQQPERYRERLLRRLQELRAEGVDEQRLAMEVALLAERSAIDEEVARLRSHLVAFRETCRSGGIVGRKLDFLTQEILRELNAIAAKAVDAAIVAVTVAAKTELEKIREQIQNIV